jgi:hypothetical protein
MAGKAVDQPCQNCPQSDPSGNTDPEKMAICQVLICAGSLAMLPTSAATPGRILLRTRYVSSPTAHWVAASPVPDPFPPRPVVL